MKFNGRKSMLRLLTAIMLLALAACTDEYNENAPKTDGDVRVKFAIQLPGANTPATRALEEKDENEVTEIDVLVFNQGSGGGLAYTAECKGSIETDKTDSKKKTFTVELKQGNYDLAIIANAHGIVAATTHKGQTKDEALAALIKEMPAGGKWIATKTATGYEPMPMWGDIGPKTINDQTDLTGTNAVPLTRMLARVDVKVDAAVGKSTFELTSVRVYNYNTHGTVAPATTAWSKGEEKVTVPTVPSAATLTKGPLVYNNEDNKTEINTTGNNCVGEIYIFEAENHTDTEGDDESKKHKNAKGLLNRTCLVVGGVYDSKTYYYRIDFFSKSGETKTYLDVLRNHQYVFNITSVSGPGYDDPETAFKSEPINIEANVLPWNQADMGNIVFDGQNMLAVSQGEFSFGSNKIDTEQSDNVFYVQTDYTTTATNGKSGWYVEKIVDATDEEKNVTWVALTPNKGAANNKTKALVTVEKNDGTKDRSAIIWIAAGRLRYAVKVDQSLVEPLDVQLLVDGQPAQAEMLFVSNEGSLPDEQVLTVNWQPKDVDMNISNTVVGSYAFPSDAGAPATGTVTNGNGGTGTISYSIKPTLPANLDENPFQDRTSKLEFTATDGVSNISSSIFVRHINYALRTDAEESYPLDGAVKSFKVRANYGWKIIVEDPDGIIQNVQQLNGKTGGYNTGEGDVVSFTMAAKDYSKIGCEAMITFENQTDKSTKTITITAEIAGIYYVGYFGGELKETSTGSGHYKFTRPLFIQSEDETVAIQWATSTTALQIKDDTRFRNGKNNTYKLQGLFSGRMTAVRTCFHKNENYENINDVEHSDYKWYLPANTQFAAVNAVRNSFKSPLNNSSYWTSSEQGGGLYVYVYMPLGGANSVIQMTNGSSVVRCVWEID
ncbi:DUF4906 domain-containing protein [Bacteroides sp. 51]|uniref:fimbrial protein n=1 Tax=Bacteroides sp. 51 TaxID=2302938 RepID=UPI0013D34CD3|nr:DUF4906 domain-containing protein [Bacteroides sp. 51]NDV81828.1 DUF4906 domain-containing protein [Bacteroides sp. 51]